MKKSFLTVCLLLAASVISGQAKADGLSVRCGADGDQNKFVLQLVNATPNEETRSDWSFLISGKRQSNARIEVVQGPRYRRGIDGYKIKIQAPGSPLHPRVVYSFFTASCKEDGTGSLLKETGAGAGGEKPDGSELECVCEGF